MLAIKTILWRNLSKNGFRSTSFSTNKARDYLNGWIGSSNSATAMPSQAVSPSLNLTGSSYLLPTLRIERRETEKSLNLKISQALGKKLDSNDDRSKIGWSRTTPWVVPIVLDLAALAPDGSPHYVPPKPGMLNDMINLLREFGVVVIGYTNYTPVNENNDLVGLPSLVSKGLVLNKATLNVNIEDVIQLVLEKSWTANQMLIEKKDINSKPSLNDEVPKTQACNKNDLPVEQDVSISPHQDDFKNSFVYYGSVRSGQQMMPPNKGQALVV